MVENFSANAGDAGRVLGLERSPGEGNGNPFQYSCRGNPMDCGAWQVTVLGVAKSKLRLSSHSTEVSVSNLKPLGETWDFSDSP